MDVTLFSGADPAVLAEINREAESLLDQQLQASIAADQRAMTFSGLLVAAVAALLGATGGRGGAAAATVATLLALAAGASLWSARPTRWRFRGNAPDEWRRDLEGRYPLERSMVEMTANYQSGIALNTRQMTRAAWAMRVSMMLTVAALIVALGWGWSRAL